MHLKKWSGFFGPTLYIVLGLFLFFSNVPAFGSHRKELDQTLSHVREPDLKKDIRNLQDLSPNTWSSKTAHFRQVLRRHRDLKRECVEINEP